MRDLKDARAFALQARKVRRKRARRNAKVAAESVSAGDETEVEIATKTAKNVASAARVGVGKPREKDEPSSYLSMLLCCSYTDTISDRSRKRRRKRSSSGSRDRDRRRKKSRTPSPTPEEIKEKEKQQELMELTRDVRTVFVSQLQVKCTEKGVKRFFEKVGKVTGHALLHT